MSEQTFIIISCTSTYGVLLCVKFNKNNTLDGFEGLQGLWTGGGGGWDFRPDRFFFSRFLTSWRHEKYQYQFWMV
jgi:hypothetical protein